ncbi:uracil-DNA glycosylase family protein [Pseudalkalibacillus hwajinpoensis]|uniref:uracil-DNA glycosylase family protein n=1 Tax=Guptibacillus hwajinpoensis TaxID=208199 RepID=UPI00325BDCD4
MKDVHTYEKEYNALAERYEVKGVITPKTKLIFILESPHVAEIKNGVPVAGPSGSTMSKKLFGEEYANPLGLLLKKHQEENIERPSLDVVGLLNVCNIPMQKRPYSAEDLQGNHELLERFESIRKANQKTQFKDQELNLVQQFILEKFQLRLKNLTTREVTLVPCGRFAQKFFRLADVSSDRWTIVDDVPHPSYNSWSRERYKKAIDRVLVELNRHKV